MFHSPTYAGIRQVGKRRVLDAHEAYISLQDWQAVQPQVPHDRAVSIQRHPRRLASPFPLSGFAFCGYCGAPLNCEPDNRVPNYSALRCSNRKHDSSACRFARMSAGAFLSGLIAFVTAEVMTEDRFRAAVGELNRLIAGSRQAVAKERRALMKEIAVVDRVIDRLLDAIEAGQGARVQGRIEQREKEKAELQARLTRLADDREMRRIVVTDEEVHETIQEMHKDLQSGDPATLRRMLQALIRRVDVCSDRVQVAWVLPLSLLTNKTVYAWYPQGDSNP